MDILIPFCESVSQKHFTPSLLLESFKPFVGVFHENFTKRIAKKFSPTSAYKKEV